MNKIRDFLDQKHGIFVGRVYMLAILFLGNFLMALGAALYFNFAYNPAMLVIGIIITAICIAILSTPVEPGSLRDANPVEK